MRVEISKFVVLATIAIVTPSAYAQTASQLQAQINELKRDVADLKGQGHTTAPPAHVPGGSGSWSQGSVNAVVQAIRASRAKNDRVTVTTTLTLTNTGKTPIALNYNSGSLNVVDNVGYKYIFDNRHATEEHGGVRGIPIFYNGRGDSTSIIDPGASRTVTFTTTRNAKAGESIGGNFDINASFSQLENLGEGRIRKVRDYSVAFVGIPLNSQGKSTASLAQPVGDQVLDTATNKATEAVGNKVNSLLNKLLGD